MVLILYLDTFWYRLRDVRTKDKNVANGCNEVT